MHYENLIMVVNAVLLWLHNGTNIFIAKNHDQVQVLL